MFWAFLVDNESCIVFMLELVVFGVRLGGVVCQTYLFIVVCNSERN